MKEYFLNYYPYFQCIASECKHTCCAGWEMDIDEQTLNIYKRDNSPFCQSLKTGVNFKKSTFKSGKNGRCAFLNQKNLCDIIINLGQGALCQVCRDHPRFRSFSPDKILMGLGFCCEQATKIILSFKDKILPTLTSDDGNAETLSFIQQSVLEFSNKAICLIQDRTVDVNQRIINLLALCNARIEDGDYSKILKKFFSLERLGKSWTSRLKSAKKRVIIPHTDANLAHYAEQFLVNNFYRHLFDAEDATWVRAKAIACVFGWWTINNLFEIEKTESSDNLTLIIDIVREYSAEVEYSQKNLDKLFAFAYKFIKI